MSAGEGALGHHHMLGMLAFQHYCRHHEQVLNHQLVSNI
jgi:hypothetical protein